ncbi:uncharacterized protein PV09_05271 [Verruconis gallopava]|uniref:Uncharacterized protein n=1 Tax=Verruconis gallopava TaxID=253628 RepID=A0A0D2AAD5_9PEZI|nr:uncharacterized protein PV09_05271 [Verruconis gallopava]KIW03505.1 hypothetical protein PV09_05271 [Verruconis gallopava]
MQVPELAERPGPKGFQQGQHELAEERGKSNDLAAENARLTFQLQVMKKAYEAEKMQLCQQAAADKMARERLEQDILRLTNKLLVAEKQVRAFTTANTTSAQPKTGPQKSSEALASRNCHPFHAEACKEKPGDSVHVAEPIECPMAPNPNSPSVEAKKYRRRVKQLEGQLKLYRLLVEGGSVLRSTAAIEDKLMDAGLHKKAPLRSYVSSDYYNYVQGRTAYAATGVSVIKLSTMAGTALSQPIVDPEGIIWEEIAW